MDTQQVYTILANNVIEYRIKNNYGNNLMYVTSEHATHLQRLTGRKTIDYKDKKALEALGFVFKQVL